MMGRGILLESLLGEQFALLCMYTKLVQTRPAFLFRLVRDTGNVFEEKLFSLITLRGEIYPIVRRGMCGQCSFWRGTYVGISVFRERN